MPRRVLMLVLMTVYTLVSAVGYAPPAHAQESEPVGKVTLRWTMTVQGSDTYTKAYGTSSAAGYDKSTEQWTDQLTVTYEGKWTWKVLRDDASDDHLELERSEGQYTVSGSGGGSMQRDGQRGPKAELCQANLRPSWSRPSSGYWVPVTTNESSSWTYEVKKDGRELAYAELNRHGPELGYQVSWDWDTDFRGLTLDGTWASSARGCGSSSTTEQCGTSTDYWSCPGSGGAYAEIATSVLFPAMQAWEEQKDLGGWVRPKDWGFSVSRRATYNPEPLVQNDSGEDWHSEHTMQGSAVLGYTLTYEREPTNLEAVITIPGGYAEYKQWQPWAGHNEDEVGNQLRVEVELRYKDRPGEVPIEKATFRFRLIGTSREPGVCLNAPPKDKAQTTPDLKIDKDSNPDLVPDDIEGDQAASTKKTARGAGVTISSYDWGAYGRLEVTATVEGNGRVLIAHLDGQPQKEQITIPLDDNDNHIADSWEEKQGVLGKNLPADWDGSWDPAGQKSDGDGISLYEKYRGFEFGSGDKVYHEQLDVAKKYIFVYDPDGIVLKAMTDPRSIESNLVAVSQCYVRFVKDGQWTGPGTAKSEKRLVNFNTSGFGHATGQHALDVRLDDRSKPKDPPDWSKLYEKATGKKNVDGVPDAWGMAYTDTSVGRSMDSPAHAYRMVVFANNIWKAMWDRVAYHTRALPEFASASDAAVQREVARYTSEHMDQSSEAYQKLMAGIISHEAGHGLGVNDHKPTTSGDKTCVMRYHSTADCPQNADDRFELACRSPWPDRYCSYGPNCWKQVQVSDK